MEPFWEALGAQAPPKNHQKWFKTLKKSVLGSVWDTSFFEGGFWEGFGRILGWFGEDFGRILGRFWKDFERVLGGIWKGFGRMLGG